MFNMKSQDRHGKYSSSRVEHAKNVIARRRASMTALQKDLHEKFAAKLRLSRSKSVDKIRNIMEDTNVVNQYSNLKDLRIMLGDDKATKSLVTPDEAADLLLRIEQELGVIRFEQEAKLYYDQTEKETEETVDHLQIKCEMCQEYSFKLLCKQCEELMLTDMQE